MKNLTASHDHFNHAHAQMIYVSLNKRDVRICRKSYIRMILVEKINEKFKFIKRSFLFFMN